ncbi:MAG: methyltransferase domain-containing protein [Candidatus Liptonbacteria bacterium]|nr:methyltransferase domain-containing protein [Candidatus Liptonbacteria bacterium]
MNQKPIKLHLGCQEKYLPGYINIDLPHEAHTVRKAKVDVEADVRDLSYPAESVDEIRSHHLLEHFSRQEALLLLARWHKWLKMDGLLRLETPDFEESARKFLKGNLDDQFQLARHIFGSHEADWAYHKDFWSENKYRLVLRELGYGDFRFEKISNNVESKFPVLKDTFISKQERLLKKLGPLGFNNLPNIVAYAKKVVKDVDYHTVIRRILEKSLVGRETKILDVWMKEAERGM